MDLRIKEIAKAKGMTYKDIAERFSPPISELSIKNTLSRLATGKNVNTSILEQFATALNVPLWQLFISADDAGRKEPGQLDGRGTVPYRGRVATAKDVKDLKRIVTDIEVDVMKASDGNNGDFTPIYPEWN